VTEEREPSGYVAKVRRDLIRGSLWTVIATLINSPIGLAASVVVARSLGTRGLGRFGTYTAIFAVILAVTNLGWSEATMQWLASATARDDEEERFELIRRCTGFHIFVAGPVAAACTALLLRGSGPAAAAIGAVTVWLIQGFGTSTVVNTASARNAIAAQISLVAGSATQVALITAAVATHRAGTTWVVQLMFLLLGPLLAVMTLDPDERRAMRRPKLVLRAPNGFWTYAASACVGGLVATLVYGRSEVIVLRANHLLVAAGIFTVITGLAGQMTGALDSVLAPLTPIAAGLMAIDRSRAVRVFERSLRITSVLGAVATCVLVPAGILAVRLLYGSAFAGAAGPFAILALVSSLQTALGPLAAFAFATRSAAQVLRINIACLAVDATVAFSCVPLFGLWGAVIANAAAGGLSIVWMMRLVSARLDIGVREIVVPLRLFLVGLGFGLVESLVSVPLHGVKVLGIVGIVAVSLVLLRLLLARFPSLGLTDDDAEIIVKASASKKFRVVIVLLRRAGIVSGQPA
jgi:O-antigen/teichoic acid export membrane protein